MDAGDGKHSEPPSADQELGSLGVTHELRRTLTVRGVIAMGLAYVSPTITVVLVTGGVFSVGGSFGLDAGLIMIPVTLCICLCLAELASRYPVAGAMYSLVHYTLPRPISILALFSVIVIGGAALASFGLGLGLFVRDLVPGINVSDKLIGAILLGSVTLIALVRVEVGAWLTKVMVVVELAVLATISAAALLHHHQSLGTLIAHPVAPTSNGSLVPITAAVALATIAPAFNLIAGYDAALGFAEELENESPRALSRAIIITGLLACVLIIVPVASVLIAAPDLNDFFSSPLPTAYSVRAALGSVGGDLVDVGAIIASIAVALAGVMYFGRVIHASGRDGTWPGAPGRWIATVNRFSVPGIAIVIAGVGSIILCLTTDLTFLLIFVGTLICLLVLLIALGSLVNRISNRSQAAPYRMPMWPVPPLVVVAASIVALAKQETEYLISALVLTGIAFAYWGLSYFWDKNWSWRRGTHSSITIGSTATVHTGATS